MTDAIHPFCMCLKSEWRQVVCVDRRVDSILYSKYSPAVSALRCHFFIPGSNPGGCCFFCSNSAATWTRGRLLAPSSPLPSVYGTEKSVTAVVATGPCDRSMADVEITCRYVPFVRYVFGNMVPP